jgi:hypothetical protein
MLEGVRAGGAPVSETIGQAQLIELIELAIRAFASYVRKFCRYSCLRAHILTVFIKLGSI